MSVARVAGWVLLSSLPLACGERAVDAVVALPSAESPSQGGEAGQRGTEGGDAGADAAAVSEPGPSGLCAPCASSSECGDANDACILHDDDRFCGRDCEEQRDCPDGYSCVELSNSQLWQCVPDTTCVVPEEPPPALGDVRNYIFARINGERFVESLAPLRTSPCLDEVAQASAVDFARTDEPGGKYLKECSPVRPYCECGWWAEAEFNVARYGLDWQTAVDRALSASREGSGQRFATSHLSPALSDVGIGFWLSGDEAWIALSFR